VLSRAVKTKSFLPGAGLLDASGRPVVSQRAGVLLLAICFGDLRGFVQFVLRRIVQCVSYCCLWGIYG